jgi:hypothetical protein
VKNIPLGQFYQIGFDISQPFHNVHGNLQG